MSRDRVNTDFKFGDSDAFMLTDIDTDESITMIPCDTAGNFSWTGVTRAPLTRNALQTSNTSNQYSDLERPWISIPQENWSGGRGNDIFSKDTTRYRDGKRAQAAFNECIYNGPLDYYSTGFRKAETNCPGSLVWKKMSPDAEKYIAIKITPKESFNARELYIHLRRRGTPTAPLVVELAKSLTDHSWNITHSYTTEEITDTLAEFVKFEFDADRAMSPNAARYIIVHTDAASNNDYWEVGIKASSDSGNTYYSANGTQYSAARYELYYRLAEAQTGYDTKFFTLEQIPFMVRQKIGEAPTLWMNGQIGKVSTVNSNKKFTCQGPNWETNVYKGARIGLVYGTGSEEHACAWRTIASNDSSSITVDKAWDISPVQGTTFIIVDTGLWTQVTGHGLTSYVTDVHVVRGVAYFAQGDHMNGRKMRFWKDAGIGINVLFDWDDIPAASYWQSVRDSSGMMLYRARNDSSDGRVVERARLLDWSNLATTWDTISTAITTQEPAQESDTIVTDTDKIGDGDNTRTQTTETTTHKIGNTTTLVTTVTTDRKTHKDQVEEKDVFTGDTTKTVKGDTTTTEIDETTEHYNTVNGNDVLLSTVTVDSEIIEGKGTAPRQHDDEDEDDDDEEREYTIDDVPPHCTPVYDGDGKLIGYYDSEGYWYSFYDEPWDPDNPGGNTGGNTGGNALVAGDKTYRAEDTTKTTTPSEPTWQNGGTGVNSSLDESVTRTVVRTDYVLRTSIVTEDRIMSKDYDARQYVITIGNFASDNNTGKCVITLQESEDGDAFRDVATVTATSAGIWRIFAHCQHPYRRFMLTALGTNCTVNNIQITTSDSLHFEDPVFLIDNYGKITRLFEYGAEMTKSLWIVQEGMLSSINKVEGQSDSYTHDRINIDELETTAEMRNGKAMATADVYLLWGWLNGLQRYYNTQLEGKGPDHDEGLPFERQGRVSQIISYPSNFFISIDGEDGYSCVMQFNQSGWHEIYRAPNAGERIYDMAFQPIYGNRPDRLWLNVGDDVVWLTMPSKILYAIQDQYAEYTHESVLVSSWHTASMMDIEKLWQTLKIMADYLDGKNCWVEADYQVDEENTWHPIKNWYTVSPSQKEELNEKSSVNGKKLRYRLRLQTTDIHKTPKVNVVVLEAVGRVDIKMSYNFYFRNIKYKRDLNAEFEDIEPLEVQDVLDRWANNLKKLRMNSRWKIFDDKLVYLDAVQTSVLNELSEGYIGQITLNEL